MTSVDPLLPAGPAQAEAPVGPSAWPWTLLSRIEDAGLNASAPPQQRWLDGWLVRTCAGKAKRARCVQAVADGRLPLDERLDRAARAMAEAGVPMVLRITPFSRPAGLDGLLAQRGWQRCDDTWVMVADLGSAAVRQRIDQAIIPKTRPATGLPDGPPPVARRLAPAQLAQVVGQLRGSPAAQREAHAQRLALSPVPYQGWVLGAARPAARPRSDDAAGAGAHEAAREPAHNQDDSLPQRRQDPALQHPRDAGLPAVDGVPVWCCAQSAREDDVVGLYDVFTAPVARGCGLARRLCATLLADARAEGARWAYLQVEADNHGARAMYRQLGFADAYAYAYWVPPGIEVG